MNITEVTHQAALVKSFKLFPQMRVPFFLAHLHPDPVISFIHQARQPPGLGLSSNDSHGLDSGFWLSSSGVGGTELVAIVMWQL